MESQYKRNIAYKMKIGTLAAGKPIMEADRLKTLDLGTKQVVRINLIANVVDKYVQEGEKRFASITLDDASGQIKVKTFGEDVEKFSNIELGDTILLIGLVRSWNNEIYVTPEIIKKKDPAYLLLRKIEVEADMPKTMEKPERLAMKDKILSMIKDAEKEQGIDIDKIILELKEHPDLINQEIKHLLEDGVIYEPRPGKLRYLG
ncbi:OB-fold nucleic acid binding domain-containing protein [Candidatus Pacearchaeota archaeon]|nr:OB-fold nucleic acid binding domain-containing protein [Candidatus Pacearchaeota archaeon]